MSSRSISRGVGLIAVLVCLSPIPACEYDDKDSCIGVDCSGHGTCEESRDGPRCDCDMGYRADGLKCVLDPSCHYDCFSYQECIDGQVLFHRGAPVACLDWTGSCDYPSEVLAVCERGCRSDIYPCMYEQPPSICCEENRPKSPGDPCQDHTDCQPPVWPDAFFDCDPATNECIEIPDPCQDVACSDNGQCQVEDNQPFCACDPGYYPEGLECLPVSTADEFISGTTPDPCQDVLPICQTTAGCLLEDTEHLESDFPGTIFFVVNSPAATVLTLRLFLETQTYGGATHIFSFYELGCQSRFENILTGSLFDLAGPDQILEISQELSTAGDHLIEISSDSTAHYYLRMELQ